MTLVIDERFVDVDFIEEARQRNTFFGDRGLPCFGSQDFPTLEESMPLIPKSEWAERCDKMAAQGGGLSRHVNWILDQKNEGSCVGNACTQALQLVYTKQFGEALAIQLSAISCYKQIGSSAGSGAMVSDGLEAIRDVGVLPLDTPVNRTKFGDKVMPPTGFRTAWPTDWKTVAKNFRAVEWEIIKSVEGIMTALLNRWPVVVGREGHSICYCDPIHKSGKFLSLYSNSWGIDWGQAAGSLSGGFGLDSESQTRKSAGWAFTVRGVVVPSWVTAA